ncbi:hypothetical protein CORC01_02883 [Colletotrichum orchidophilum]|uniref:F-box domain-containing protein n=1 Tax=Colletotrichum orchidophilum TaxID=1209926 RepID=A0A1G4BJS8_9PEZI|nr:uncharacterized protein CORC01_02883 [Colletotrichum orchidophilum]OHF01692.1 hypothetical protein CORC01_02883 [Colletotrichum orchidophilum]
MGTSCFIKGIPLHILAEILSWLDTLADICPVIQSHRIFWEAFRIGTHAIARNIVARQIPPNMLPFAAALIESKQIYIGSQATVKNVLLRLEARIHDDAANDGAFFGRLTLLECASLSRDLSATVILKDDCIWESLAAFTSMFQIEHQANISEQEHYRLNRAFLRYQLMCNLFCVASKAGGPREGQENSQRFFATFSPWVNEQLMCVYVYLERKITDALDDVAMNDVEWGSSSVDWSEDGSESSRIQWHLSRGLPFMLSLLRAKLFHKRRELLPFHLGKLRREDTEPFYNLMLMLPRDGMSDILSPESPGDTLRSCSFANIRALSRPSDGTHESGFSTPHKLWAAAHGHQSVCNISIDAQSLRNHWDCIYLMWDVEEEDRHTLEDKSDNVLYMKPSFHRAHESYAVDDVIRSEKQRSYIWLAGGRGYWPFLAKDFSGVSGLSENQKENLLARFKSEEEMGVDHAWGQQVTITEGH